MNYQAHYDRLIARAKVRALSGYIETHHMVPKCMGGDDSAGNLVELTPEEHFVAHQLLHKMHPSSSSLAFALIVMIANRYGHRSNKLYGWIRKRHVANVSVQSKARWQDPAYREKVKVALAKACTPEVRERAAASNRGRKRSLESRAKMSAAARARTPESNEKSAAARRGKKRSPEICLKMAKSARAMSPIARARIAVGRWPQPVYEA